MQCLETKESGNYKPAIIKYRERVPESKMRMTYRIRHKNNYKKLSCKHKYSRN